MTIKAIVFDAYGTLYDVHSVASATDAAFPGHGDTITQIWRLKQLEYSWLRTLMGRYEDFRVVTLDSLRYTLDAMGLQADAAVIDGVLDGYDKLQVITKFNEADATYETRPAKKPRCSTTCSSRSVSSNRRRATSWICRVQRMAS